MSPCVGQVYMNMLPSENKNKQKINLGRLLLSLFRLMPPDYVRKS